MNHLEQFTNLSWQCIERQLKAQLKTVGAVSEDGSWKDVCFGFEVPKAKDHGDLSTAVAMQWAPKLGKKPRELSEMIAEIFKNMDDVVRVEIAGPGFINLTMGQPFWQKCLYSIIDTFNDCGTQNVGTGEVANVEYVSANPTGLLHIGHVRGAVVGDVMANLLAKVGYKVVREYYINDDGQQIDVLARSAYLRYLEALGQGEAVIPEGLYPGEYLKDVAQDLVQQYGDRWVNVPESSWLPDFKRLATDKMMDEIRKDLKKLGVDHDVFSSERHLVHNGDVAKHIAWLEQQGLVYRGVSEPPKGKISDDWMPEPLLLFKATEFGDEVDRPVQRPDGEWTYFGRDIAYHVDKFNRGARLMLDVLGADHGGYVQRIKAALTAVTQGQAQMDVLLCQMVKVQDKGEVLKMSKRAGSFVTLRELMEHVHPDVIRFTMLMRRHDQHLDFDITKVREQSMDNPVFYVQYAYARGCSVFRQANQIYPDMFSINKPLCGVDLGQLTHDHEHALIKMLSRWDKVVRDAANSFEPHRIAFYLHDVAGLFHSFWNAGRENPSLRFVHDDNMDLTAARLALVQGVLLVIKSGLGLIGVTPMEEM